MFKAHVYPRGFMSGARNDDVEGAIEIGGRPTYVETEGDDVIMALYNEYMAKSYIRHSADFQIQLVKRFLQLMGPANLWMERQVNRNRFLYDQNYEFLLDTFKFIHTGRRSISNLLSWYQLLSEYPDPITGITQDRWNSTLRKISSIPTEELMAKWLSHPTGLDDLMQTAFIMFGDSKTPRHVKKSLIG
jgi:hypothetical protein